MSGQRVDFHIHSRSSDGVLDAAALAQIIAAERLALAVVTDHDIIGESAALAALSPDHSVVGIELTTAAGGHIVDLLGLGLRRPDALAAPANADRRRHNEELACRFGAAALARAGFALSELDLGRLGAVHSTFLLAQAVLAAPANAARLRAEGIDGPADFKYRYLAKGAPASFAAELALFGDFPSPAEGIAAIGAAGGRSVLAHPGLLTLPDLPAQLRRWREAGLFGLESEHPAHDGPTRARLARLARRLGLYTTYGSDTHHDLRGLASPHPAWSDRRVALWREILGLE